MDESPGKGLERGGRGLGIGKIAEMKLKPPSTVYMYIIYVCVCVSYSPSTFFLPPPSPSTTFKPPLPPHSRVQDISVEGSNFSGRIRWIRRRGGERPRPSFAAGRPS